MSEDFATLVSKLNEMSEDNYQKEEVTKEVVTESANDMRGILDKFNTITESNILAQKGNIKMVMTESVQIQLVERYADALQVGFLAYAFVDLKVLRSDSLALARGVKF